MTQITRRLVFECLLLVLCQVVSNGRLHTKIQQRNYSHFVVNFTCFTRLIILYLEKFEVRGIHEAKSFRPLTNELKIWLYTSNNY